MNQILKSRHVLKCVVRRAYVAPVSDMKFLIKDVLGFPKHYAELGLDPDFCGEETIDAIVTESARFAENILTPLNDISDAEGCTYIDKHNIKPPSGFRDAYIQYCNGGWQGLNFPICYGGQGLPNSMGLFQSEIMGTACQAWSSYPGLSRGAIRTLITHASEEVKDIFVRRMVSGEWTGTMCLTEPQCGSDLNQVATTAEKVENGLYKVNGTKIFISCGEHDMASNIIHLVLARVPGASSGTRGLSLFAVPKHFVHTNGSVDESYNGVNIGRIETKMGYHGTPTCEINFEGAMGYLIGSENKGMAHMFTFMNTARLGVALQGVNGSEKSFQHALKYSKERRAFRSLVGEQDPFAIADPIIVHPDIRRMLLTQKAVAEGGRMMVYTCALLSDKMISAFEKGDFAAADAFDAQLGFMTPIAKGFLTEIGIEATSMGIQIFGGHGYIRGNKQEQIYRDVRISAIWEGTTQIQALDFLRRKIFGKGLSDLTVLEGHCQELQLRARELSLEGSSPQVRKHADVLYGKVGEWLEISRSLAFEIKKNPNALGVAAVDYLMYAGHIMLADNWLRMEEVSSRQYAEQQGDVRFHDAKIKVSAFVFSNLLPRTEALKRTMFTPVAAMMDLSPEHFSIDY